VVGGLWDDGRSAKARFQEQGVKMLSRVAIMGFGSHRPEMIDMLSRLFLLSVPRTAHASFGRTDPSPPFIPLDGDRGFADQIRQQQHGCSMMRLYDASWAASPTKNHERSGRQQQDAIMMRPTSPMYGNSTGTGAGGHWAEPEANTDRSTARVGLRIADAVAVASGRQ
jgi:hypothetical protein